MFAIFLTSVSKQKDDILSSIFRKNNKKFSNLEREYLSWIKSNDVDEKFTAHEPAEILYSHHQPIGSVESGLYLMWFSVYVKILNEGLSLKNKQAWAAAIEYVWLHLRYEKITQAALAGKYNLSTATLQKYVKQVKNLLV